MAAFSPPFRSFLSEVLLGNSVGAWLGATAVAVGTVLLLKLAKRIATVRLAKIAERTSTTFDDLVVDLVRRTATFTFLALGVAAAHPWLSLPDPAQAWIRNAVEVALWVQLGLWGLALVQYGLDRMVVGKPADDPARTMGASVLGFVARTFLWTIILLSCLSSLGHPIGPMLASLGIGGIAVALALQNVLGDLFASITILLDKPFVVGDTIILGEFHGVIERIGIKTSRIRSISGEEIIIGNYDLVSSRVRNYKRMRERRQVFVLGITYQTAKGKVDGLADLLKEIVEGVQCTRFEHAHLKSFGASSLDFEVVYHVQDPSLRALMETQHRINLAIYDRFAAEGIEFAYPTQTLLHQFPPGTPPGATQLLAGSSAPPTPPSAPPTPPRRH